MGLIQDLDFAGVADKDESWKRPTLEAFGVKDGDWDGLPEEAQREIANNFLVNDDDEFPPENYSQLKMPVVDPKGTLDPSDDVLNFRALKGADARAGQVEGVSEVERQEMVERIDKLKRRWDGGVERGGMEEPEFEL